MTGLRLAYSRALAELDPDQIAGTLADDVVITVAVHDAPMAGKDVARVLFGALSQELTDFKVTEELLEADSAVVLFEAKIGGHAAQGLNVVRLDPSGQVRELIVFFRPLASLQVIGEKIGARMAARFGPPG